MAIELCLFDLDNTLLHTSDLEPFRGRDNVGVTSPAYTQKLLNAAFGPDAPDRHLYTPEQLTNLRNRFPKMQWGVFTRSPRHYATTLLEHGYPKFKWDYIIGREDVINTKPYPDGVWIAAEDAGIERMNQIALIGDEKTDVVCAYRAGCWSFIDQTTWNQPLNKEQWRTLERVPDALFTGSKELTTILSKPYLHAPELERLLANQEPEGQQHRIDKINHFFPINYRLKHVPIFVMGRLFGDYEELKYRRNWHTLTDQIHSYKNAEAFPDAWIIAIQSFIQKYSSYSQKIVVTVIPFKPGRKPRLEALLNQVAKTYTSPKLANRQASIEFITDILEFRKGAISSHGHHLNAEERFKNVGDNLFVKRIQDVRGKHVIVIDDVVTTGATLLWAHRYLIQSDADKVSCLSLAKAIGAN